MPIEIKELIIKTVVDNAPAGQNQQAGAGSSQSAGNNDNLITLCVEQVMEIIKNKNER
jgi:hypothetical protein